MAQEHNTKVLIIGSGPAGYTAAIYAARANLEPMMVMGLQPGGQLTITTDVENYPGFANVIQGPWLMDQMKAQAEHVGTRMIHDLITEVDFSKRPFVCKGDSGDIYVAESVIISTGAQARWLGLPGEEKFNGRGVSACATCDGFFYRNKPVVVVGGGNTAVEEALYLAGICSKVTLVHRRDELRAEKMLQDRLLKHEKIDVVWDSVIDDILGGDGPMDGVEAVRVRNVKTGDLSAVFKGQIDMDDENYILVKPGSTTTNVHGVFAAGDVTDKIYRQAVTAAGMGCMAALEAEKFIAEHNE